MVNGSAAVEQAKGASQNEAVVVAATEPNPSDGCDKHL
jgi:hypothetical protein